MNYQSIRVRSARLSVQEFARQWRMTLPVTESVKLLLMLSGAANLRTNSGTTSTLLAGHVHLSSPGQSGELWAVEDPAQSNCRLISGTLDVSPETMVQLANTPLPAAAPCEVHNARWLQCVQLMGTELSYSGETADVASLTRVTELLLIRLLALQQSPASRLEEAAAVQDSQLERCLQLINNRLDYNWTLDAMASAAGMSRSAFARRFQAQMGVTPMAYLNAQRLIQAKSALQNSQLSVTQISDQLGYSTDTVFRRNFRRATGESPSQFRNNARRTRR